MNLPEHLLYSSDHEWIDPATGRVGITAYAAELLGDIVYLLLPQPGTVVTQAHPCGEVESTKSVSELYAPASGVVEHSNETVMADPSLINSDPYGLGWLYQLQVYGTAELLSAPEYSLLITSGR
jgi:glycine cleavage system H protein